MSELSFMTSQLDLLTNGDTAVSITTFMKLCLQNLVQNSELLLNEVKMLWHLEQLLQNGI